MFIKVLTVFFSILVPLVALSAQEVEPTPAADEACALLNIDASRFSKFGSLVARADGSIVDDQVNKLGSFVGQSPNGSLVCVVLQQRPFEMVGCFNRRNWTLEWRRGSKTVSLVTIPAPYWVANFSHQNKQGGFIIGDAILNANKRNGMLKVLVVKRKDGQLKIAQRRIGTFTGICNGWQHNGF